jgi:hypothetical protein
MFVSCSAAELSENPELSATERLGLCEPFGGLQQLRQVVEADGDIGMLRPVAFLIDCQRTPHQRKVATYAYVETSAIIASLVILFSLFWLLDEYPQSLFR